LYIIEDPVINEIKSYWPGLVVAHPRYSHRMIRQDLAFDVLLNANVLCVGHIEVCVFVQPIATKVLAGNVIALFNEKTDFEHVCLLNSLGIIALRADGKLVNSGVSEVKWNIRDEICGCRASYSI